MKRTIGALLAGLVIGGATLGPLAATAAENATLRQRVSVLEQRLDTSCRGARIIKPAWYAWLHANEAC